MSINKLIKKYFWKKKAKETAVRLSWLGYANEETVTSKMIWVVSYEMKRTRKYVDQLLHSCSGLISFEFELKSTFMALNIFCYLAWTLKYQWSLLKQKSWFSEIF